MITSYRSHFGSSTFQRDDSNHVGSSPAESMAVPQTAEKGDTSPARHLGFVRGRPVETMGIASTPDEPGL